VDHRQLTCYCDKQHFCVYLRSTLQSLSVYFHLHNSQRKILKILFRVSFCLFPVMTMDDSRTQRPYRYGMILLCLGALINWLGISEPTPNAEPIRYLGVACILGELRMKKKVERVLNDFSTPGGALLICTAMCCWLKAPNRTSDSNDEVIIVYSTFFFLPFYTHVNHHHSLITKAFNVQQLSLVGVVRRMKEKKAFNDSIN
jgi:hypothetical protein